MEPIDLRPKSNIFVASDTLQTAKELQIGLASAEADKQPALAVEAIELLGDPRELLNSHKIVVHALGAVVLYQGGDAASSDEQLYHETFFSDATFRSCFSRFTFIQHQVLSGLCLRLSNVEVLASPSNPEFVGEHIRSGMFVPVHAVETLIAA